MYKRYRKNYLINRSNHITLRFPHFVLITQLQITVRFARIGDERRALNYALLGLHVYAESRGNAGHARGWKLREKQLYKPEELAARIVGGSSVKNYVAKHSAPCLSRTNISGISPWRTEWRWEICSGATHEIRLSVLIRCSFAPPPAASSFQRR